MELRNREDKKQYKLNTKPIVSLIIGLSLFSIILLVTMLEAGETGPKGKSAKGIPKDMGSVEDNQALDKGTQMLAVVKEVDKETNLITLFDINSQELQTLSYTGGSNIIDKYQQPILAEQIPIGSMVDVEYAKDRNKLQVLQISTRAWEYAGVNNLVIDTSSQMMKIAATNYRYTDNILIFDGQDIVPITNIAVQDELTVRGYEETICSITVTRGHGTVILEDYEPFLGANITIGYEAMQQITEDLNITVREGNFNLTVETGNYSATKKITVHRNQETYVSLSDIGPEALKIGRVTFEITPFGADLYIDGKLSSYANPLELTYGKHSIEVSLGGYTTYRGAVDVDVAGKIIKVDLPEGTSNKKAEISEVEDDLESNTEYDDTDEAETNNGINQNNYEELEEAEEDYIKDEAHSIHVQNPIGASVYLNGKFKGISPITFTKVIGSHVLTFIKEGYETKSYTIEVLNDGLDTYFSLPDLSMMQ